MIVTETATNLTGLDGTGVSAEAGTTPPEASPPIVNSAEDGARFGRTADGGYDKAVLAARLAYEKKLLEQRFGGWWNIGPCAVSHAHRFMARFEDTRVNAWVESKFDLSDKWKSRVEKATAAITKTFNLGAGRFEAIEAIEEAETLLNNAPEGPVVAAELGGLIVGLLDFAHECIRRHDGYGDDFQEYIVSNGFCLFATYIAENKNNRLVAEDKEPMDAPGNYLGWAEDFVWRGVPYFTGVGVTRGENFVTEIVKILEGPDGSRMPDKAAPAIEFVLEKLKKEEAEAEKEGKKANLEGELCDIKVPHGKLKVTLDEAGAFTVTYPDEEGARHEAVFPDREQLQEFVSLTGIVDNKEKKNLGFAQAELEGATMMAAGCVIVIKILERGLGMNATLAALIGSALVGFGAGVWVWTMAKRRNPLSNNTEWLKGSIRAMFNVMIRQGLNPLFKNRKKPEVAATNPNAKPLAERVAARKNDPAHEPQIVAKNAAGEKGSATKTEEAPGPQTTAKTAQNVEAPTAAAQQKAAKPGKKKAA